MSNILIFRGKSATGKTSLTDLISRETGISILRKDDIYDELHKISLDHTEINNVSYEIMTKIIQTNINTNSSKKGNYHESSSVI